VPIVTFHGPGGGIELLPGWRTALGGIGADHGAGLLLAGHPLLARALGLGAAADAARTALLAALPPPDRARHPAPAAAGTCPRRDSNPHSSAFKAPASAVGLRGRTIGRLPAYGSRHGLRGGGRSMREA
jgi:hypothetical protein